MSKRSLPELLFANLKLLAIGGVCLFLLITTELDEMGLTIAITGSIVCLGFAAWRIWKGLHAVPAESPAVAPDGISHLPPAEQVVKLRKLRLFALLATWGFGVWTWSDLTSIEQGKAESVYTWAPIAMLYDWFGFWPAVLAMPVLGVVLWFVATRRIEKAEAAADAAPPEVPR